MLTAEESMDNEKDCGAENDFLSPESPLVDAEAVDGRDEGMQKYCGAENDFLSPESPLVDAEAVDGRDEGMQKYVNGDNGVPGRENGEPLPSPRQSNETENVPLDQGSAIPSPLDEQQESAPIEDASEKGGLVDTKHAVDTAPADMEPQIDGLEEIRQGEAPVETELESAVKASAEIDHELGGEPSVGAQSITADLLETERERQDLAQLEQGNTGDSELGEGDASGRVEYNMNEKQEQFVNDAAGTSFTTGVSQEAGDVQLQGAPELVEKDIVVSEENSEERIQGHSASNELNQQVDLEIPIGNVSVPDDAFSMKKPSLSTPAMEALIDADNEEPSHEQESFGTVENSEQHLEATETHEEPAGGDKQDAFEGISNQVEVDNNELESAENNAFGEDDSSLATTESAVEVLVPSGHVLGMDMPSAGKEELGNEPPLVFEQETEQLPVNEASSVEPHVEWEIDIEAALDVGLEPTEQSLDTAPSSSDLKMAADINEKGHEVVPLKAEDTINVDGDEAAASEVEGDAIMDSLEETSTENESGFQAWEQGLNNPHNDETFDKQMDTEGLPARQDKSSVQMSDEALPQTGSSKAEANIDAANGQLDEDDPMKRVQDEQGSVYTSDTLIEANQLIENCDKSSSLSEPSSEREHEGHGKGDVITTTQLESTADGISNGVLESSVTSETPNKIYLSEHMLENGNSLQSGEEVEGSYVGHLMEPVLELGKVSDGMTEGEAPITALSEKGLIYKNSESENESSEGSGVGTQAAEAKDRDLDPGEGKERVGGEPSHTDATSSKNSLARENGFLKHSEGDFEKESQAKDYTNGTANTCDTDKENAQAFHNERSREASLSLLVPQQRDMVSEHMGRRGTDHTNGRVTLERRTNWWGCCGMLDLLLHKD